MIDPSEEQATSDRLRTFLKRKYSLVHVPSRHKAARWTEEARLLVAGGMSPEAAGLQAARKVFPYECKEHALYAEGPAEPWIA